MRKIIQAREPRSCQCGNPILPRELCEVRMGRWKKGIRCLGCYVRAPQHWVGPVRKAIPYPEALKAFNRLQAEQAKDVKIRRY